MFFSIFKVKILSLIKKNFFSVFFMVEFVCSGLKVFKDANLKCIKVTKNLFHI